MLNAFFQFKFISNKNRFSEISKTQNSSISRLSHFFSSQKYSQFGTAKAPSGEMNGNDTIERFAVCDGCAQPTSRRQWENACQRRNIEHTYTVSVRRLFFQHLFLARKSIYFGLFSIFPYLLVFGECDWIDWSNFSCVQSAQLVGKNVAKISAVKRWCTSAVAKLTTSTIPTTNAIATGQSKYATICRWSWPEFSGECRRFEYFFFSLTRWMGWLIFVFVHCYLLTAAAWLHTTTADCCGWRSTRNASTATSTWCIGKWISECGQYERQQPNAEHAQWKKTTRIASPIGCQSTKEVSAPIWHLPFRPFLISYVCLRIV